MSKPPPKSASTMKMLEPRLTAPIAVALSGKMADHDGVNDGHAHPAEFGEHQRQGEAQRGGKFFAKSF